MEHRKRIACLLLALVLVTQLIVLPNRAAVSAAGVEEVYQITPYLSEGITVPQAELDALTVSGTRSGDSFTFTETKTLSFTATFGDGWSYSADCSNFFPSDAANASVTQSGQTATFAYHAAQGRSVALEDLENVILNAAAAALPKLSITIDGDFSSVTKDEWVSATFELTLGTKQFASGNYSGVGSVKGRGNTSWSYAQKPYSIKLEKKASLLDIPKTKKYAIISNYGDTSMLRNYITYKTGLKLLGIDYTPKAEFVQVELNGRNNGIYLLVERIDIESTKIDIEEATADNITGGYIIEKDAGDKVDKSSDPWFNAPFQANPNEDLFTVKAPDPVTAEMLDYLEQHMQKLHDALMGVSGEDYTRYIDVDSWVDFLIMQELSKNVDGNLKTSCYFYKEKDIDTVYMTALWDFDNAYGTANWNNASSNNDGWDCPYGTGTSDFMVINSSCPWFQTLYAKEEFAAQVKQTYTCYRETIIPEMQRMIDTQQAYLTNSVRENGRWTSVWSFDYAVDTLKNWLDGRIAWLDARWLVESSVTSVTVTPESVTLQAGQTQQFKANVVGEGLDVDRVTWSVEGASSAATRVVDGLLTVGADETAASLTVTATSVADPTRSGSAIVHVAALTHAITVSAGVVNGTITPSVTEAARGAVVTLTVEPAEGYRLREGTLKYNGVPVEGLSFVMPDEDVVLTAIFEKTNEEELAALLEAAQAAQKAAEEAQKAAEAAQEAAEKAKKDAEGAASSTAADKTAAEEAQKKAEEAQKLAEEAREAAKTAQKAAEDAAKAAEASNLAAAQQAAEAAAKAAEAATKANEAAASAAAATEAMQKAQAAQAAAEKARDAANDAQKKAEEAQKKAEEAAASSAEDKAAAEKAKAEAEAAREAAKAAEEAAKQSEEAAKLAREAAEQSNKEAAASAALAAEYAQKVAEQYQEIVELKLEMVKSLARAQQAAADAEAEQKAAEAAALASAKYYALFNLSEYVASIDTNNFTAAQKAALDAAVAAGRTAIEQAKTIEGVEEAAEAAQKAIGEIAAKAAEKLPFADVAEDAWYYEAVKYAYTNKLVNGMDSKTFAPEGKLTRAQLVTILYRQAGTPEVKDARNPFADVKAGEWYSEAIVWAAENKIVNGTSDTTFNPNGKITREQIATILYRYAKAEAVEEDKLGAFPDAKTVSDYAKDAMNWAVAEGLINGSDGKLLPQSFATRAQIAAILMRYLEK